MKFQDQPKRSLINGRLLIYTFIVFFILVGSGEAIARTPFIENSRYVSSNPLQQTGYGPAIDHFKRIKEYAQKNGSPQCIFFGSSLVQTGVAPDIFANAFQTSTGDTIHCYNAGMDASTLSSTVPLALLLIEEYRPLYVILGIQTYQFLGKREFSELVEDKFQQNSWLRFKSGDFNLEGWLVNNSKLYSAVIKNMANMFPTGEAAEPNGSFISASSKNIRPEVPRIITPTGYGPLPGYRDSSPLFQATNNFFVGLDDSDLDPLDFTALERLMNHSKNGEFELIIFEVPINNPSSFVDETTNQIELLAHQNGIPFLSTDGLAPLPETAYSDQIHMQISGSYMFSEWLGSQIGEAVARRALSNINDPIWYPTLEQWDTSIFENTLGLNESDYRRYLEYQDKFDLVPNEAIIFNPSLNPLDKTFAQSLVGFSIDWEAGITGQDRLDFFQLMVVLGRMLYQNDLNLSSSELAEIDEWRTTLDPSILSSRGIQYVVCREELADLTIMHCPSGLADNLNYVLVDTWKFDPLYERYSLYQIVGTD